MFAFIYEITEGWLANSRVCILMREFENLQEELNSNLTIELGWQIKWQICWDFLVNKLFETGMIQRIYKQLNELKVNNKDNNMYGTQHY